MIREPDDLAHVLRMVLNDNMGQRITEALIIGIDEAVHHYLGAVQNSKCGVTVPYQPNGEAHGNTPTQ